MARFAFERTSLFGATYRWRQLHLVTDGKVTTVEMLPALWEGWNVKTVRDSKQEDWADYTTQEPQSAEYIAEWIRHNWTHEGADVKEIDPSDVDGVIERFKGRQPPPKILL